MKGKITEVSLADCGQPEVSLPVYDTVYQPLSRLYLCQLTRLGQTSDHQYGDLRRWQRCLRL